MSWQSWIQTRTVRQCSYYHQRGFLFNTVRTYPEAEVLAVLAAMEGVGVAAVVAPEEATVNI